MKIHLKAPIDALISGNESVTLAAGKGVAGLFIRPIGAVTRLISDTGKNLLSVQRNKLKWDDVNESQSRESMAYYLDDHVLHIAKCQHAQHNAFLILTKSHLIIVDLNLTKQQNWQVRQKLNLYS